MRLDYWNVDGQIDVESLPACPFCDQPMQRGEELKIIEAQSCLALAHSSCCIELDDNEPDR